MFLQNSLRSVRPRCTVAMLQKLRLGSVVGAAPPLKTSGEEFYDYEEAIQALNTLQSNAASIRQSIINKRNQTTLSSTVKYLNRSGITLDELDKLSVIHVSGTKGKGSTCAQTESILRAYGVRTGFFSSPHLVSVTERIRIDGQSISKKKFTQAFWIIFNRLEKNKESENDMPPYFHFLTILCFHIFLEEKLDVAILEVGIGGEHDCTNIVRNTPTVGITSLGLEHTNILGDTIQDIARQKAGIIKTSSNVYTNVTQSECLQILKQKTMEKNAKLIKVPDILEYHWPKHAVTSKFNKMVQLNGSLAIQLAYNWLRLYKSNSLNGLSGSILSDNVTLAVSDKVLEGFNNCVWPGRCQTIDFHNFRIHLDGAHTRESINICSDWFQSATKDSHYPKILIFNATGDRDAKALLKILRTQVSFSLACFVPNIPVAHSTSNDVLSVSSSNHDQLLRAEYHRSNWQELTGDDRGDHSKLFGTIIEAFSYLNERFGNEKIDVLITGSLHLLGAAILALEEYDKRF